MQIEQINYCINWRNFKPGYSFFIPCISCSKAKLEIKAVAKRLKYRIVMRTVVEEGIRGVRVWRT
jgi:hypothetical protein